MIEALHKIFLFAGKEKKNIYKSIFVSFLKACFNMLRIAAIYVIVTALVSKETSVIPALTALLLSYKKIPSIKKVKSKAEKQAQDFAQVTW